MQATHVPNPTGTDDTVRQPAVTPTTYGTIELTAAADQTGKEGYFVEIDANQAASVCNNLFDFPFGVILTGAAEGGASLVAICAGGFAGTVRVKLNATPGTVKIGTHLQLAADGTAKADAGAGSRNLVAQALEAGGANALILAALYRPISL
jgi:hypothetical protein